MTSAEILTFGVVAGLLVMSPGPNGVLIARTVPISGRQAGFANIAGFVLAFYLHGALAILGLSLILMQSATAFSFLKYLGAAYLCWIGLRSLWDAVRGAQSQSSVTPARRQRSLSRAFGEGFLTNTLNPKVSMFYLAAFPQFVDLNSAPAQVGFALVSVHAAINLIWFGAMVLVLARLTRFASDGRFQRWLKGVTGVVFLGFGAKLASLRPQL